MTHEDLRSIEEKIAEKFYRIYGRREVDIRPWSSIGHEVRAPYLLLAAEAVRLMTWIRRDKLHEMDCELTLPADGWQP